MFQNAVFNIQNLQLLRFAVQNMHGFQEFMFVLFRPPSCLPWNKVICEVGSVRTYCACILVDKYADSYWSCFVAMIVALVARWVLSKSQVHGKSCRGLVVAVMRKATTLALAVRPKSDVDVT